jgi:hypothetical protein
MQRGHSCLRGMGMDAAGRNARATQTVLHKPGYTNRKELAAGDLESRAASSSMRLDYAAFLKLGCSGLKDLFMAAGFIPQSQFDAVPQA